MRAVRLLPMVLLCACATTSPRFEQQVASTFAQDDMHKLETPELELYYPANYAEEAKRVAARAAECVRLLREHDVDPRERDRALLFLTSANFNNAYVGGQSGGEPLQSLIPLTVTDELFHFYGLGGANAGDVACHEMFHYVHFEQTHGFWNVVNTVLGPVLPPQAFLERWFTEGVAQFYEGRLLRKVGRPSSPFYRASFDSFVAMRGGHVMPGDLQIGQRELYPHSGAYLAGLHFIEWLAEKYGEDKLWKVMDVQSRSVFSPLGYTLRFKSVYGLSVGALVEEWEKDLTAQLVKRERPATEKILVEDVGQLARLATHAGTGAFAVVSSGIEQVSFLRIYEANGTLRAEQRLTRIGPGREFVYVGPGTMSGLSFTEDGKWLYLLNDDLISRGDTRAQIWKIDAQTAEVVKVVQEVGRGMSGSISADGRSFTFVDNEPGHTRIVERDLETGVNTVIEEFPPGVSVGSPSWNRKHDVLVYSRLDGNGWNLVVRDDGATRELTYDGQFNYGARWLDDDQIVFARTAGKYLQAHRINVRNVPVECERLSDAPFGILDVGATPNGVVFTARDGIHWSIDSAPSSDAQIVTLLNPQPDSPPPSAPAPLAAPELQVSHDEPYSSLDHLFVPQLRMPIGSLSYSDAQKRFEGSVGLSLMGRDRLSKHTWAINGLIGIPEPLKNSLSIGYRNLAFAPWSFVLSGARVATADQAYWNGLLAIGRDFFSVPISFGVSSEVRQTFGVGTEKWVGPWASIAWSAGDSTAYAGSQRAFSVSLDVAGYPRAIGSDRDMLDLRGTVSFSLPLPLSKRHAFSFGAIGRALPGAPSGVLQLGGVPSATTLLQFGSRAPLPDAPTALLPGTLVEGVRGFDDFIVYVNHAAIFNARYRYSFIIDRGTASILWLGPSFFFRQIDLEAFGSGAITDSGQMMRGVGAALHLRSSLGGFIPVSLNYQFAYRFDFGLPPLHVVSVSFD